MSYSMPSDLKSILTFVQCLTLICRCGKVACGQQSGPEQSCISRTGRGMGEGKGNALC